MVDRSSRSEWAERIWAGEVVAESISTDANVLVVRRIFNEIWGQGKLELIDELLDDEFVDHSSPPGSPPGRRGYRISINNFRTAFPDVQFTLDQVNGEGDRVAIRLTAHGTHKGHFMGIAPTGKTVSFGGMAFVRLKNGKVIERWGISDIPGLLQQLGDGKPPVVPAVKAPYSTVDYVPPAGSHSSTRVLGVTNSCKATKNDTRGIYSLFVSTVPAGEGVPIHVHLKEDEAYYILDGTFEIYDTTNHNTITVGPDSYAYVPMNIQHGFKNVGDGTGRMILLITPGGLEGFFEEIGQVIDDPSNPPPAPTGLPDFARAARIAARYNITFVAPTEGRP